MNEEKFWIVIGLLIAVVVTTLVVSVAANDFAVKASAFQAGYEQVVAPGSSATLWQEARK